MFVYLGMDTKCCASVHEVMGLTLPELIAERDRLGKGFTVESTGELEIHAQLAHWVEQRLEFECKEVADTDGSTRFALGFGNTLIQVHYARYGKVTKSKRVDNAETLRNYIAALQFWQCRINQ